MNTINFSAEQKDYITNKDTNDTKLYGIPGAGKTRCIIGRIEYLASKKTYDKDNIFVLTFSRFAITDFIDRIKEESKLQKCINIKNITTIDSMSKKILSSELSVDSSDVSLLSIRLRDYLVNLKDKLGLNPNSILHKIQCLFVDEAQDLNNIQYDIISNLKRLIGCKVNLIGDPNQNIYQFRNSSEKYLLNYDATQFLLTKNFRSNKHIVNFTKHLRPNILSDIHHTNRLDDLDDSKKVQLFIGKSGEIGQDILDRVKNYKKDRSNIAIIAPTRGISKQKGIGLSVIANLFKENDIEFIKGYDDSGSLDDSFVPEKFKKEREKVNLLTYTGTKGLEYDVVYLIDFTFSLMNRKPSKEDHEIFRYLLYVATSRAKDEMVIYCNERKKVNPVIYSVPKDVYNTNKAIEYNEKDYIYNNKKDENTRGITEILSSMSTEQLSEIEKMLNIEIKSEKIMEEDYTESGLGSYNVLMGIYMEKLFLLIIGHYQNKKPSRIHFIEKLLNSKHIILDEKTCDYFVNFFKSFGEIPTWKEYDDNKVYIKNDIRAIINKHYDRNVEFGNHHVTSDKFIELFDKIKDSLTIKYNNYLNSLDYTVILEDLFYLVRVEYFYKNNHYCYIEEDIDHLLDRYYTLIRKLDQLANEMVKKYKHIDYKQFVENKQLQIMGEIDLILDDTICEIKFTRSTNLKHSIQLFLYNICYFFGNPDKFFNNNFHIYNFQEGKRYDINISIKKIKMIDFYNIISDITNMKIKNTVIAYDTETTGLIDRSKPETLGFPEIIQLSMVEYYTGMIVYNNYVSIAGTISPFITELTKITNEMIHDKPDIDQTRKILNKKMRNYGNIKLCAHNGKAFDDLLMRHYKLLGACNIDFIDTKLLFRLYFNDKKQSMKLTTLYNTIFGKDFTGAHSAINDVYALIDIIRFYNIAL